MELNRLRELRKKYNLTQSQIADVLNVATSTYTQYELGTNKIPLDALIVLSGYFKVSIDYLVANPNTIENEKLEMLRNKINQLIDDIEKE